jgi:hypothetical protein
MATNRTGRQGKLDFVRKILEQNRDANEKIVNQAWQEAGNEGKISRSAVGKVRALMGLTSGKRAPRKKAEAAAGTAKKTHTRSKAAKPRDESPVLGNGTAASTAKSHAQPAETSELPATSEVRAGVFDELESDLDRVLFRVMSIGNMPEVERLIRHCRRIVIRGSGDQG